MDPIQQLAELERQLAENRLEIAKLKKEVPKKSKKPVIYDRILSAHKIPDNSSKPSLTRIKIAINRNLSKIQFFLPNGEKSPWIDLSGLVQYTFSNNETWYYTETPMGLPLAQPFKCIPLSPDKYEIL